ncbi:MAG: hypothetical protein RIC56_14355 [Pseudomonadales bacterium]
MGRAKSKRHWLAGTRRTLIGAGALFCCGAALAEIQTSSAHFESGCAAELAGAFDEAVTELHSFEYPESERLFRAMMTDRPDCAMARWGVAMSLWHQIWVPPSAADLAAGEALLAGIDRQTLRPREAAYVEALSAFYADHASVPHAQRAERYRQHMKRVYLDHLDDPEAALLYALALLATADPTDKDYRNQLEAAAVLNWARERSPHHPGVLHYLIHSYDYPGLAHLALSAAMTYAEVAPDSAHAQHMPSHIFTRLGLWQLAIHSNQDSTASAAAYTERAHLPGHYDEGLHSIDYLMYALLQVADDDGAARLLDRLNGITRAEPENFKAAYTYAAAPARYALERRQWREAGRLEPRPADFPWADFPWAVSINLFARGLGAARSGQIDAAKAARERIATIAARLPGTTLPYWREQVTVQATMLGAWIALAEGDASSALERADQAAALEDSVDKHPVTPGEVLPARELLGDMALQLDRPELALDHYRRVLRASPKRTNALLGAARAELAIGDRTAAAGYYRQVVEQTGSFDARDGVREARSFLE